MARRKHGAKPTAGVASPAVALYPRGDNAPGLFASQTFGRSRGYQPGNREVAKAMAPCDAAPDEEIIAARLERLRALAPALVPRVLGQRW